MNFYLHPSRDYSQITAADALNLDKLSEYLTQHEKFIVPYEFFEYLDEHGQSFYDFLNGKMNDIQSYLLEIVSKSPACQDTYENIHTMPEFGFAIISENDRDDSKPDIYVYRKDTSPDVRGNGYIPSDVVKAKRHCLQNCTDYEQYKERAPACFPSLIFHPEAFDNAAKLGAIKIMGKKLTNHLAVLNDYGKKIYQNSRNEKIACNSLKACSSDIIDCVGKGKNQTIDFKKDFFYNGHKYVLTCNPHTKFLRRDSDQRLYFCWGNKNIQNHDIIIVRIGDHWE